jgi:hypothetical protein
MMMLRRTAELAMLASLAACGTASDAVTFHAPPGYTQTASVGPFVQVWKTTDNANILTLLALPAKIDLDKALSQSDIHDAEVKAKKNITICGGQEAIYADIVGTMHRGGEDAPAEKGHIEFLATNVGGKTYMAVYVRPLSAPVDPVADAAIHAICPK